MAFDLHEMKSSLARLMKSPVLAAIIGILAVALLVLAVRGLNDPLPELPTIRVETEAGKQAIPVTKIEALLAKANVIQIKAAANGTHAFFTRHFEPPPPPPPKPVPVPEPIPTPPPQPPPPTTRKAALLYRGDYKTAGGAKRAFVQVETVEHVLTNGAVVIADWSVADIAWPILTLTNRAAQTNVLEFNKAKELEVPIK